jgi:hypothetical protein
MENVPRGLYHCVQLAGNERIFLRAGEKSTLNLIFIKFRFDNICPKINESYAIKNSFQKKGFQTQRKYFSKKKKYFLILLKSNCDAHTKENRKYFRKIPEII